MSVVIEIKNKNKKLVNKDNELPDISLTTFKNIFREFMSVQKKESQ